MRGVRLPLLYVAFIVAIQVFVLYLFGQPTICECGYIKLWEGIVLSPGNSQHLTDWYTFSHVIHGFAFYLGLWLFFPRLSPYMRLAIAVGIEASWEMLENTPMVIDHYRQQALAQGYTGDSIINSAFDTGAMVLGFVMARTMPVWSVVTMTVGLELFVLYSIRDNLTLNIMNLIYQVPAISEWQSGLSGPSG